MTKAPFRTLAEIGRDTFALFLRMTDENVGKHADIIFQQVEASFAAERDRFKIWAIDLGLLVPGHGSLDYRVREAESLANTLQTFLIDLNQSLSEVLERVENPGWYQSNDTPSDTGKRRDTRGPQSHSGYQDGESDIDDAEDSLAGSESDIELLLDSVRDIIDRLYKLSTKIRNPSTRLASSKARGFQQIDEDSGTDLLQALEHYDYDYVRSVFHQYNWKTPKDSRVEQHPAAPSADSQDDLRHQKTCGLCKSRAEAVGTEDARETLSHDNGEGVGAFLIGRIARANIRRRQQFGYWKKHRDKLTRHTEIAVERAGPSPEEAEPALQADDGLPKMKQGRGEALPAQSVTTASRLQPALMNLSDNKSTISVSEYAPSASDPNKETVDFPAPPKRVHGQKFFNCPYCFTTCPSEVLSDKAWRAHLIHDLRPYLCTYLDCKGANQLYDTRRDWIQHENSFHRKSWQCPEHSEFLFLTVEAFGEHIRGQHVEDLNAMSTESFLRACESVSPHAERPCPVCFLRVESVRSLQKHIALHLERLAIFSLPRSTDDDGSEKEEMKSENANYTLQESRDGDFESSSDVRGDQDHPSEYERWAREIDQFRTLKLNNDFQYNDAEELYEKLRNESREFGEEPNKKAKLLSLHTAYVDMQIERKNYLRAEEVARETWQEYEDEDTDNSRLSYRQLCEVLRQQGPEKYSDLEDVLRETWPGRKQKQSQPLWRLENGEELCSVLELKGDFESANALRRRLWGDRKEEQTEKHKDTVQAGIRASQCKLKELATFKKKWSRSRMEAGYEDAMKIVQEIWKLWDPDRPSEADVDILAAGYLLGYIHYYQKAYTDAGRVLDVVWKERKAQFTQSREDTILTGHYLSQTYFQLRNYRIAKLVFEEIWNTMKFTRQEISQNAILNAYHLSIDCLENHLTTRSENKPVPEKNKGYLSFETLNAWLEIGWAMLNQEKYKDAACILQQAYNSYRAASEAEQYHKEIFTCGRYLNEAIAKQGKGCSDTTSIPEKVLEEQT